MEQNDLILVGNGNCVIPKSIQEDEISRDGGRWPEYAYTMTLCVDDFGGRLANGRLYSFCERGPRLFHSLDQLLFELVSLLDDNALIMASMEPRSIRQEKSRKGGRHEETGQPVSTKHGPAMPFEELHPPLGRVCTCYLRIYARQNASIQGVLTLAEKDVSPIAFRSALELIQLLREYLLSGMVDAE